MARGPMFFFRCDCALPAASDTANRITSVANTAILRYKFQWLSNAHDWKLNYWRKHYVINSSPRSKSQRSGFHSLNEDSQPVSLKDFTGRNVVLFFYPKAGHPRVEP